MACLDDSTILDYVRRQLSPERRAEAESHLAGCPDCRKAVSALAFALQSLVESSRPTGEATEPLPWSSPEPSRTPELRAGAEGPLWRGAVVGRYLVLEPLGSGGMGVIYKAYDPELNRQVALKLVRADVSERTGHPESRARLLREAQAMARLSHPNVVSVYDVGTWGTHVFIAMEFVDGGTLHGWLREQRRPWREVLDKMLAAGRGLAAAHAAGLVHRDFKPANVLLGRDGRVRVTDFGLVRSRPQHQMDTAPLDPEWLGEALPAGASDEEAALTRTGVAVGTPAYMAPEQHKGAEVDARSDQFSFCVSLYEGLYGERPFPGNSRQGVSREPPKDAQVPAWLLRVLLRGLSVKPEERYPSMEALLEALSKDPSVARRRWAVAGVSMLMGLVLVAGSIRFARRNDQLCTGAERKLAGVWDESVKPVAYGAFLATGTPYAENAWQATSRLLDGYAASWVAMHTEACEATRVRGEQSEELLSRRMVCLERRRREMRALSELLRQSDAKVVEKAAGAASALSPVADCADVEALSGAEGLPGDPAVRAKVEEVQGRLADAKALLNAGKYKQGLEIAAPAAEAARETKYRPLEAEALLLAGDLRNETGEYAAAETTLLDASRAAVAAHGDAVMANAFLSLAFVTGVRLAHRDDAWRWLKFAEPVVERLGPQALQAARMHRIRAALYDVDGKAADAVAESKRSVELSEAVLGKEHADLSTAYNQLALMEWEHGETALAVEHYQHALALVERAVGPEHPDAGRILNNLCVARVHIANKEDALRDCERALALRRRLLGPDHPEVASTLGNVALALSNKGQFAEALEYGRRAMEVGEKAWGPAHPNVGITLINQAVNLKGLGRYEEASRTLERALAILEKSLGPAHARVATALHNLGDVRFAQRRYREALAYHQRSLAVLEKAVGPEHPNLAFPLTGIGEDQLELRASRDAVRTLERALRLREHNPSGADEVAETRFALARALWESGRDRPRARSLAEAALPALRQEQEKALANQVEAWLATHRVR